MLIDSDEPYLYTMKESLNFTLIQTNLHWEDKIANLAMLSEKIASIHEETHIILLPEMFSTGFSMRPEVLAETMEGNAVNWMRAKAAEKNAIICGSLIIESDNRFYNRLIWMLPNGQLGFYDKRHCFGFAGEDKHYSAGNKRLIAQVAGWKINLQICYDLRFPVWARQQMDESPEYDVLLYVANWPERRNHAWKTLLAARAIENQCYVIGLNRVGNDGNSIYHSGDSRVIDPMGDLLYEKTHEEDVFTIQLSKSQLNDTRNKLPFLKDADQFIISNV